MRVNWIHVSNNTNKQTDKNMITFLKRIQRQLVTSGITLHVCARQKSRNSGKRKHTAMTQAFFKSFPKKMQFSYLAEFCSLGSRHRYDKKCRKSESKIYGVMEKTHFDFIACLNFSTANESAFSGNTHFSSI